MDKKKINKKNVDDQRLLRARTSFLKGPDTGCTWRKLTGRALSETLFFETRDTTAQHCCTYKSTPENGILTTFHSSPKQFGSLVYSLLFISVGAYSCFGASCGMRISRIIIIMVFYRENFEISSIPVSSPSNTDVETNQGTFFSAGD